MEEFFLAEDRLREQKSLLGSLQILATSGAKVNISTRGSDLVFSIGFGGGLCDLRVTQETLQHHREAEAMVCEGLAGAFTELINPR